MDEVCASFYLNNSFCFEWSGYDDFVGRLSFPSSTWERPGGQCTPDISVRKCLYFAVLILYHALLSSLRSLEVPWWSHLTFLVTRSCKTWFCQCIKKRGKNLSTRSSNSLASWIIDGNLALVKAKNILFPDLWESTWPRPKSQKMLAAVCPREVG